MKRIALLLLVIFTTLASNNFARARAIEPDENFWLGDYTFGEDGGRTAGGTPIFVVHSLGIRREADTLVAEIVSNGYQTSRHLVGTVKVTGNTARIYFKSYGEDNMYEPYGAGDLLLTLKRVVQKGKTRILTYWNAFEPAVKPLANGRVYFKRERASGNHLSRV